MTSAALPLLFLTLLNPLQALTGDVHLLEYLYTIQSKNSNDHLYDCTAVTLLNDRQIYFYNSSSDESRTAKQNWLKIISQSDWKTSTEKPQYDRQLLNKLLDIQMDESGHSNSDGHVLQWRHNCVGERQSNGSVTVSRSINEFAYDGEELVNYDCTSSTWHNSDNQKKEEIEKLSAVLLKKCSQCEEMLKIFLRNNTFNITPSQSPPAVHVFARKSEHDSSKLILTCLATGFYPKDVKMSLRKFTTSFPDHLITSSAVRPNDDGTYQLRKSVEIQEDDPADYYCYVNHSSLQTPVIKKWDEKCINCTDGRSRTGLIIVLILVVALIICVLIYKKPQCVNNSSAPSDPGSPDELPSNSNGGVPNGNRSSAGSTIVYTQDPGSPDDLLSNSNDVVSNGT